ncbi:hypothetical protein [Endozoicomonas sp. 4G]|uniref:hypothetical protein n=1 Tax=Endozoicomonas sp. 4G TaxID=2872754 RepID=UPI002078F8E1|nr:hypothetical protein [Endozoicomonas sp. 4G]
MKKNYLTIILAAVLFSSAVWAADSVRTLISGRFVGYTGQDGKYIWILDSENGKVKYCYLDHFVYCKNTVE